MTNRKSEEGRYGRGGAKEGTRIPFYWVQAQSASISQKTPFYECDLLISSSFQHLTKLGAIDSILWRHFYNVSNWFFFFFSWPSIHSPSNNKICFFLLQKKNSFLFLFQTWVCFGPSREILKTDFSYTPQLIFIPHRILIVLFYRF